MSLYPAFRELASIGFKNMSVKLDVINDPVEKELITLEKNYGTLTDIYFDAFNRLTSTGYLLLDQIVILMNRNPGIRIEVGVHTDNQGIASTNLTLSQTRAQVMVNYLVNRGINVRRLIAKGYGGDKPVASNATWTERKLNRRIDLRLIN